MTTKILPPVVTATDIIPGDYITVHTTLWPIGSIDLIGKEGTAYRTRDHVEENGDRVIWVQFFTPDAELALTAQLSDTFTRTHKSYDGHSVYRWSA